MTRLLALLLLVLTACGGEPFPEQLGGRQASIVNGTVDTGHPSVGMLDIVAPLESDPTTTGYFTCSGTLVGQRTVITAAHCVDDATEVTLFFGSRQIAATSWTAHPAYDDRAPYPADFPFDPGIYETTIAHDIAVVLLSEAPQLQPHAVASQRPTVGTGLTLVGFGVTSTHGEDSGTKRIATNTISGVDANNLYFHGASGAVGSTCFGDSGGPAFMQRNGAEVLTGVTSHGLAEDCGVGTGSTRVDLHLAWIQQVAAGDVLVDDGTSATTPPTSAQDTTPPQVQIVSPTPNATIGTLVDVAAQVADDGPIATVTLMVDGIQAGVAQQAPFTFQAQLAPGTHLLRVVARDAAGNEGETTVTVYSSPTAPAGTGVAPATPTNNGTPRMIVGACSVGGSAGSFGFPLLLLALALIRRRRK